MKKTVKLTICVILSIALLVSVEGCFKPAESQLTPTPEPTIAPTAEPTAEPTPNTY